MLMMKALVKSTSNLLWKTPSKVIYALIASALLSACGESVVQSGGGAGDTAENARIQAAITLLQPYVGIYLLQDGWRGDMGDVAYLSIGLTANDGISEAALIDYDDTNQCVPARFSTGVVRKDDFSDRVFMDDVFELDEAELSLNADNLMIQVSNGTIGATKVGITVDGLGPTC
jgi:hypothetical protein